MNKVPLIARLRPYTQAFDPPLLLIILLLACAGLVTLYSAGFDFPGRFADQMRNYAVAFSAMWLVANLSPSLLMRLAVPMYILGLCLLLGVEFFGEASKGARRWLNLGITRIQPSEMMKIAMPMMLAWYFHKHETMVRLRDFLAAGVLLGIPFLLIAHQPDLGTALLVFAAGFFVIFFAGLSWRLITPLLLVGVISVTALVFYEDRICQPEVDWKVLRTYQKHRICTLLDPTQDPLGKGFHIIQSTIAVGSGGIMGKGWMQGTQTHLEFIPERTTDFIFAVYAEEFGFIGCVLLVILYLCLVFRGLLIAANGPTFFCRLLAGSISLMFFTYVFVNIGMVSGILPVVGVPLPFMSYGGTALLTLGIAAGILMSIQRHRKLIQT